MSHPTGVTHKLSETKHWGARDLRCQLLFFLHPAPGTGGDTAAGKFLGCDTAGVLASWGQRLAQLSAWGKLPVPLLKRAAAAGQVPTQTSVSVHGRGLHRHSARCCHLALQQRRLETWHIHVTSVGRSCVVSLTVCQRKTKVYAFFFCFVFLVKRKRL